MVRCYHVYNRKADRYEGHMVLCEDCEDTVMLGDNMSLHDSGPSNMECEACGEMNDG